MDSERPRSMVNGRSVLRVVAVSCALSVSSRVLWNVSIDAGHKCESTLSSYLDRLQVRVDEGPHL
jgi:hypothetical protein